VWMGVVQSSIPSSILNVQQVTQILVPVGLPEDTSPLCQQIQRARLLLSQSGPYPMHFIQDRSLIEPRGWNLGPVQQ
jgi:hypothetical protein